MVCLGFSVKGTGGSESQISRVLQADYKSGQGEFGTGGSPLILVEDRIRSEQARHRDVPRAGVDAERDGARTRIAILDCLIQR